MAFPAYTDIDFVVPFHTTGANNITGAQLEQLVGGLEPYTGIGLFVATSDDQYGNPQPPNPATYPKLQTYGWLRLSAGGVGLYVWNPLAAVSGAGLLKWQLANIASIAAGSVTGQMIAPVTITDANILSVGWNKLPNGGAVGGVLTGNMPNPGLAPASISMAALIGSNIPEEVLMTDTSTGAAIGPYPCASSLILSNSLEIGKAASPFMPIIVTGNGLLYNYKAHDILQMYTEQNATNFTTATICTKANIAVPADTVLATNFGVAGTISFTPLSAHSSIIVECDVNCGNTNAADGIFVCLFQGGALEDYVCVQGQQLGMSVRLTCIIPPLHGIGAFGFTIQIACLTGGSAQINIDAVNQYSMVKITEYL